jgi:hypothetical protein
MAKHLAGSLEVDDITVDAVVAATAQQQHDEACQRILARETAYRAAFRPHLRTETTRTIPEPIFVAALVGTARLRLVRVSPETWHASTNERDGHLKRAIQDYHREHGGYVPAFGDVVGYTAVVMAGYRVDFGLPYDLNGDLAGPMQPVKRLGEAGLGTKRGDSRLPGLFRETPMGILA